MSEPVKDRDLFTVLIFFFTFLNKCGKRSLLHLAMLCLVMKIFFSECKLLMKIYMHINKPLHHVSFTKLWVQQTIYKNKHCINNYRRKKPSFAWYGCLLLCTAPTGGDFVEEVISSYTFISLLYLIFIFIYLHPHIKRFYTK